MVVASSMVEVYSIISMIVDKILSRIFVRLQYKDEDPIVEKTGTVIYNRKLHIRYSNMSQKQTVYVLHQFAYIKKSLCYKNTSKLQMYILSNIPMQNNTEAEMYR